MKKIYKYLALSLVFLMGFICKTVNVDAASASVRDTGWKLERQQFIEPGKHHMSDKFNEYYIDGRVSYCIEPNVHYGKDDYIEGTWEDIGFSNDLKERITLIAYYGYTYPNHQTLKYRAATQAMIWEAIMGEGSYVRFSKDYWSKGEILDISAERAEIENLIAGHYTRPSFNGGYYQVQRGKSISLTDTNNVLSQYDVNVSGADYSIEGNTLTITPNQSGSINVSLNKRMPYDTKYKLFVGDGIQKMIVPGTSDPVVARIQIETFNGSVEGNKLDKETGNTAQGQATLKGAKYGIYESDTGNLVTTFTTDENGHFKSDNILESKEYYIQEISPSEGYKLDKTRYNFSMVDKETAYVDLYEEVVKNYVSILKQYDFVNGNTTFLDAEAGINFEIYFPDGRLFDTITTDKNGYATINLPYGIWKFHQVNTTSGYEKIYDFYITVDYNTPNEQKYNILNNALSAYLQVFKTDSVTGKTIALANTTFKIFNKDKNEYVTQFVGGKVYDEFTTDEEGKFTTYLKLESGNYTLIETSSPNGYLIAEEGVDFTIGNDTRFSYTTYGPIISMNFNNTPIRGKIEIHKQGEVFTINNGTFNYNGRKSLEGITYVIYADEDIKTSDGNYIYYEKDEFVGTLITDKNGYAISESLPLGKYRVQEVRTNEDYLLDETIYKVELTEIDNKTEIVYSSNNMLNLLKKGDVEFTKTDFVDDEPITGVLMELYTESNELIFSGKTDANGKILIKDLKVGRYYFVEKETTTGYLLNEDKLWFEITEDGEVVKSSMTNKRVEGIINIHKDGERFAISDVCEDSKCFIYETNENLEGIKFELYAREDIILNNIIRFKAGDLVATGTTDENGNLVFSNLYLGKYFIKEVETKDGYVLDEKEYDFELEYVDSKTPIIETSYSLKNYLIKSDLEFTKVDLSDGTPLPNTLVEIYNENDELIFSGRTDENGKIVLKNMPYGKYYILEKEAPEGYVLNEEPMPFEVKENGEVIKATMEDEKIKSTILIHKVDQDGKPLVGVTIGIYDLEDNLIYEGVTNEEGNIEVEIEYGKYYFQEIATIDGYVLSDEKVYFDVTENGAIIENSLINIEVPNTSANTYINLVGGILAIVGIGFILISNKNNKKKH